MTPPEFHTTQHGEPWDGITERRKRDRDSYEEKRIEHSHHGSPNDPITREYLDQALSDWRHASREYFNTHFHRLEELIRDGFPDGEPRKHREVHEGYIKKAKSRSEMWEAVVKSVVSGGVWVGVTAIATALWVTFKAEVRK